MKTIYVAILALAFMPLCSTARTGARVVVKPPTPIEVAPSSAFVKPTLNPVTGVSAKDLATASEALPASATRAMNEVVSSREKTNFVTNAPVIKTRIAQVFGEQTGDVMASLAFAVNKSQSEQWSPEVRNNLNKTITDLVDNVNQQEASKLMRVRENCR